MIDPQHCLKCRNNLMDATRWWYVYLKMNPTDRSTCLACQVRGVEK